jgi:carboxyl-terminal processing protease
MHRSHAIRWILLNLTLGLAGGITLGWGPLAASTPAIVLLGLAGALLGGAIGRWTPDKAQRRWVWVGHGVILLALALAAVIPLYRIGMLPLPGETRGANFERLWRALDYAYPYFAEKGVDWDTIYARYAPQAQQAQSDEAYWRVVAHMLAELNDGHTGLLSPSVQSGRRYFATGYLIGEAHRWAVVVDEVGATARAAGLERGDEVLAVDERPVEDTLDVLSPVLVAGSTPQQRRAKAAFNILSTTGDALTVTVRGPAGERTLTLVWPTELPAPQTQAPAPWQPLITGERLPSGLGLIRIPDFGGSNDHNLVAEFDAALDTLMDAPGLILDLRGNGGGSTHISDPIAGRFFNQPFTYGRDCFRARLPQRGWRAHFDYRVTPRGQTYTGPLVLLIDTYNFSTAENFIVALIDSGRATTVGRPTGGGSGNPVNLSLPGGGRARFSTGAFRRNDGSLIEGAGIAPDHYIFWTVEDFRAGHDPDLQAAERLLTGATGAHLLPETVVSFAPSPSSSACRCRCGNVYTPCVVGDNHRFIYTYCLIFANKTSGSTGLEMNSRMARYWSVGNAAAYCDVVMDETIRMGISRSWGSSEICCVV